MAQELKSSLQPYTNDTLMRYLETSTVWLCIARFAFTDGFCRPCKAALVGPVGPLGCTNQSWCGVQLLAMSVSTHPVGCVYISVTCCGDSTKDSTTLCTLMAGFPASGLPPTPTTPPHPSHPPSPIHDIRDITGAVKNYLKTQLRMSNARKR